MIEADVVTSPDFFITVNKFVKSFINTCTILTMNDVLHVELYTAENKQKQIAEHQSQHKLLVLITIMRDHREVIIVEIIENEDSPLGIHQDFNVSWKICEDDAETLKQEILHGNFEDQMACLRIEFNGVKPTSKIAKHTRKLWKFCDELGPVSIFDSDE